MDRKKLEALVWKHTSRDFRGKSPSGERTVLQLVPGQGTCIVLLSSLSDVELFSKLPLQVRVAEGLNKVEPGARVRAAYGRLDRGTGVEHTGEVLATDDPRAWEGTIAFSEGLPTVDQVRAHLAKSHIGKFLESDRIPVLWSFGKVYWEKTADLMRIA